MKYKGILITLEGNEGCGKSTQINLLEEYLKSKKRPVFKTREPGGTETGNRIRTILLDSKLSRMSPVTETFLYMASRSQLAAEVILPRLKRGEVVICDRWLDATIAYQGFAGGLNVEWIRSLGRAATLGIVPAVSLYLDLPVRVGLARAKKRQKADRIEKKSILFHERVRTGFLAIAKKEPARFIRIPIHECESIQMVHEKIRLQVDRVLSKY